MIGPHDLKRSGPGSGAKRSKGRGKKFETAKVTKPESLLKAAGVVLSIAQLGAPIVTIGHAIIRLRNGSACRPPAGRALDLLDEGR